MAFLCDARVVFKGDAGVFASTLNVWLQKNISGSLTMISNFDFLFKELAKTKRRVIQVAIKSKLAVAELLSGSSAGLLALPRKEQNTHGCFSNPS